MSSTLAQYQNGNCRVTLYEDGSKEREWSDGEMPCPKFPESIDLKITDWCDAGCAWCHESSTTKGLPASWDWLSSRVAELPAGMELAIGGGHPMSYRQIEPLLTLAKERGLICNMTVNGFHVTTEPLVGRFVGSAASRYTDTLTACDRLSSWQRLGLLHGIGVTNSNFVAIPRLNNMVAHVIAGIAPIRFTINALGIYAGAVGEPLRLLVLGFKRHGRGVNEARISAGVLGSNLADWRRGLGKLLRCPHAHLAFDNLALAQLDVERWVKPEVWNARYMGADGQFTMYVDAVRQEYAASSTSRRFPIGNMTIVEAFKALRQVAAYA